MIKENGFIYSLIENSKTQFPPHSVQYWGYSVCKSYQSFSGGAGPTYLRMAYFIYIWRKEMESERSVFSKAKRTGFIKGSAFYRRGPSRSVFSAALFRLAGKWDQPRCQYIYIYIYMDDGSAVRFHLIHGSYSWDLIQL